MCNKCSYLKKCVDYAGITLKIDFSIITNRQKIHSSGSIFYKASSHGYLTRVNSCKIVYR